MPSSLPSPGPARLGFIDLARAVAILLMLEGHFIDVTLAGKWRVEGSTFYAVWTHFRGVAAPMFFTVTGVIFAYLLTSPRESGFWQSRRVRRGLRRVLELFFWGYLLQIHFNRLPELLSSGPTSRTSSFHVLQCIGTGLLVILALHGVALACRAGLRARMWACLAGGFALFGASVLLANHDGYLPPNAPVFLQNPIRGPVGPFPIAPWLGFTLYGAAIGIALRRREAPDLLLPLTFFGGGLLLALAGWQLDHALGSLWLDLAGHREADRIVPTMFHGRFGEILLILGILMAIERRFRSVPEWLQKIGRQSFFIYVGHVVVLYGGLFGIGLHRWLRDSLNPWQAALGAVLFCGFFGLVAQLTGAFALRWREWRLADSAS